MLLKRIIFIVFILGFFGCQKYPIRDLSEQDKHQVVLRIKEFQQKTSPKESLMSLGAQSNSAAGILYFWSFNQENDRADLGIDILGARIFFTSHSSSAKASFPAGYAYQSYPAGKSYSIAGLETLTFSLPLTDVARLTKVGFDAGSSSTGPKDFIISYSVDGGEDFEIISLENPLLNPGAKNTYEFDLSSVSKWSDTLPLIIKLTLVEGDRTGSGAYNRTTGTFKIDNFRLEGIYAGDETIGDPVVKKGKMHYYLFNKNTEKEILTGNFEFEWGKDEPEFRLRLPEGDYNGSFLADFSQEGLLFSDPGTDAGGFFVYSLFQNFRTEAFGTVLKDIQVQKDLELDLSLERYYSEITVEFTDTDDLSYVSKIEVREKHDARFWPFREEEKTNTNNVPDAQGMARIFLSPFSNGKKEIRFDQFLGKRGTPVSLEYEISVYGLDGEFLRNISVQAVIKNNIKLLFRGKLATRSGSDETGFPFRIIEKWDGSETYNF